MTSLHTSAQLIWISKNAVGHKLSAHNHFLFHSLAWSPPCHGDCQPCKNITKFPCLGIASKSVFQKDGVTMSYIPTLPPPTQSRITSPSFHQSQSFRPCVWFCSFPPEYRFLAESCPDFVFECPSQSDPDHLLSQFLRSVIAFFLSLHLLANAKDKLHERRPFLQLFI